MYSFVLSFRCVVQLGGHVLADVVSYCKSTSRLEASQEAIDELRKCCWTVIIKQAFDSSRSRITKDKLLADLAISSSFNVQKSSLSTPISDGNRGKQMLLKMGWKGGGIGKQESGMQEPISIKTVINREGLRISPIEGNVPPNFHKTIREFLNAYAASERQDDLVFSSDFNKSERVVIHSECRRFNLKSKSVMPGKVVVVSRKRTPVELLDLIMRHGGETPGYRVIPPGESFRLWSTTLNSIGDRCDG